MKRTSLVLILFILLYSISGCANQQAEEESIRKQKSTEFSQANPIHEFDTLEQVENYTSILFTEAPLEWKDYQIQSYQAVGEEIVQITYANPEGETLVLRKGLKESDSRGVSGDYTKYEYGTLYFPNYDCNLQGDDKDHIFLVLLRVNVATDNSRFYSVKLSKPEAEDELKQLCNDIYTRYTALKQNKVARFYDSFHQYYRKFDPNGTEEESIDLYESYFTKEVLYDLVKDWESSSLNPRFHYAYINEDSIPELLVCFQTMHGNGVFVFTIDHGQVYNLGEFGTYGNIAYIKRKNRFYGSYGNQGCFRIPISKIAQDKAELVGCLIDNNSKYYADFPLPEGLNGSNADGWEDEKKAFPDEEYNITEAEFKEKYQNLTNASKGNEVHICYDDMASILPIYMAWDDSQ